MLLAASAQAFAQKANTIVSGKIAQLPANEWIYIGSFGNAQRDSVQQNEKGFRFDLHIPEGEGDLYMLQAGSRKLYPNNSALIYLEKGKLKLTSGSPDLTDAKYSGGKLADFYNDFRKRPVAGDTKGLLERYNKAQQDNDQAEIKSILAAYETLNAKQKELDKTFVLKHKNSPVVTYPLFFTLRGRDNLDELEQLLAQVSPKAKNNLPIKSILHSIKTDKLTGVGRTALPFSQADTAGKVISLSDFKGKYVLVDFWASWCVPCRIENPNVVAAYQQYKNKNFTVLGVSFDYPGQNQRWLDAIHSDNLTWSQVSDLKGWNNEVGVLYDIKSIPSNLLIDPNGVIIGKNLKGETLDAKLQELLGTPQMEPSTFVLKGQFENTAQSSWFYVRYDDANGKSVRDSVRIFNGTFSYVGRVQAPTEAMSYFTNENGEAPQDFEQYLRFYIEPGVISLSGDNTNPKKMSIIGGKAQESFAQFNDLIKSEIEAIGPINEAYNKESTNYRELKKQGVSEAILNAKLDELEKIKEQMEPFQKTMMDKQVGYIKANPDSHVSATQLRFFVSRLPLAEVEDIYGKMGTAVRNSRAGRELAQEIASLKSGSPGSVATDFSGADINGQPLKLSDYRGKYVLLDFWASWCVPCRKGNPHLLQVYSKYKKKGFEIIGVSDDDSNLGAWKKAVDQDKIGVWKHVLRGLKRLPEGGYDKSDDKTEAYGIHSLPTKILIDPKGVIIGRYGGGADSDEDLDAKLKEVFKI